MMRADLANRPRPAIVVADDPPRVNQAGQTLTGYCATFRHPLTGRPVSYCDPAQDRAETMARQALDIIYNPPEPEHPCGLFKGPEDY